MLGKLKLKKQDNEFFVLSTGQLTPNNKAYKQQDVKIIRTYRFEDESDPAIIYVIRTSDGNMGYCIDGYGMYSSHTNDLYRDFIKHATIEN